jgi:exopolysaccharide biosynthesis polyprenyl glycosylphosphotransferase
VAAPSVQDNANSFWKRAFDITVATILLLASLPVMLVIALLVKFTSKGPVFYKSKRIGLGGKEFNMYKFRSMYTDADARLKDLWAQNDHSGPCFKMKNDPRITPIGLFIRKYSLDELPQFVNVLMGECSIVGPRALHRYEVEQFDEFAMQRLAVKPGLTCYWQISGRSNISFDQWMELDVRYVKEMSFLTDLAILAKTPKVVLFGIGAY